MAIIYVRSTDGNNADSGATWALAKLDLAGAAAIAAVGDTVYVSHVHAETTAAGVALVFAGTNASPNKIICANDGAAPPTAVAATATVTTTGTSAISLSGAVYCEGITFNAGTGGGSATIHCNITGGSTTQKYKNCNFNVVSTSTASHINVTQDGLVSQQTIWEDCSCSFGNTATRLRNCGGTFRWTGGSLGSGVAIPAVLLHMSISNNRASNVLIENVDLSVLGSGASLVSVATFTHGEVILRNIKLGASVSVVTGTWMGTGAKVKLHNSDSADTNYRMEEQIYAGSVVSETVIVRTGGASDGTTALSWKMATSANSEYPLIHLESPEMVVWNETVGSAITVTAHGVHDSQGAGSGSKFQDDEIWIEVQYLGTSGFPRGVSVSDVKADVLATAANQADSTETWTTTGLTTPVKQALSVTFTPQEKGFIHAKFVMAKASKTCYMCQKLVVT